jgi:hypothetical protein
VIDVFHNVLSNMTFARVYVLAQQADPSSAKNSGKEKAEAGFRLFWNNINRLIVDYRLFGEMEQ